MAKFSYTTKYEILPPKVDLKGQTPKMRAAINKAITRGMQKATTYVSSGLKTALDGAMSSTTWSWPRETFRQNGDIAGTSRDIVDTGKLKNSLELKEAYGQTKSSITIKYGAPYAALMHYGGAIQPYGNKNANTVLIPGRPWITGVVKGENGFKKYDMVSDMQRGFEEVWTKQFG